MVACSHVQFGHRGLFSALVCYVLALGNPKHNHEQTWTSVSLNLELYLPRPLFEHSLSHGNGCNIINGRFDLLALVLDLLQNSNIFISSGALDGSVAEPDQRNPQGTPQQLHDKMKQTNKQTNTRFSKCSWFVSIIQWISTLWFFCLNLDSCFVVFISPLPYLRPDARQWRPEPSQDQGPFEAVSLAMEIEPNHWDKKRLTNRNNRNKQKIL